MKFSGTVAWAVAVSTQMSGALARIPNWTADEEIIIGYAATSEERDVYDMRAFEVEDQNLGTGAYLKPVPRHVHRVKAPASAKAAGADKRQKFCKVTARSKTIEDTRKVFVPYRTPKGRFRRKQRALWYDDDAIDKYVKSRRSPWFLQRRIDPAKAILISRQAKPGDMGLNDLQILIGRSLYTDPELANAFAFRVECRDTFDQFDAAELPHIDYTSGIWSERSHGDDDVRRKKKPGFVGRLFRTKSWKPECDPKTGTCIPYNSRPTGPDAPAKQSWTDWVFGRKPGQPGKSADADAAVEGKPSGARSRWNPTSYLFSDGKAASTTGPEDAAVEGKPPGEGSRWNPATYFRANKAADTEAEPEQKKQRHDNDLYPASPDPNDESGLPPTPGTSAPEGQPPKHRSWYKPSAWLGGGKEPATRAEPEAELEASRPEPAPRSWLKPWTYFRGHNRPAESEYDSADEGEAEAEATVGPYRGARAHADGEDKKDNEQTSRRAPASSSPFESGDDHLS